MLLDPNHAARVNESRNTFFSSRSEKKSSLTFILRLKKHKNAKIEIWFIVVCTLIDNDYAISLFSQTYFSYCCCKTFWKKSMTRTSSSLAHLHNAARALSSPSRCFCQQILAKISFVIFDIVLKKQIECGLAWTSGNSTDLGLTDMFSTGLNAEIVACTLLFR